MKTKKEKSEYNKQYRLKNTERIKQYRIDNKERNRKKRIEYDIKNKEKIIKRQKVYGKQYRSKNAERIKQYRIDNKEKIKQYPSNSPEARKIVYEKYRKKHQNKIRNYKLIKKYNITLEDYNSMYNKQNGMCCICNTYYKELVVDHNHENGKVRGLLCDICNRGLGHFKENIETLQNAINYLINNK